MSEVSKRSADRLGDELERLRRARGLSLREAAERAGVSHQTIFRAEKGDVTSAKLILKLLAVYKARAQERQRLLGLFAARMGLLHLRRRAA
jgi:transcriptional regulator with XRE-family HTH domain